MSTHRSEEMAALAKFRSEWHEGIYNAEPLPVLIEKLEWFESTACKYTHHKEEDIAISEEIRGLVKSLHRKIVRSSEISNRIAFFKPSWSQAQILNAWHPEFEPEKAPNGYSTLMDISAVRAGKSAAACVNQIAWIIPNDPEWLMFQPYTDFKGRHVQVLRRPNWDYWERTGKMEYDSKEPPKEACECWHGCPDEMHWKEKLNREYMKWMPGACIGKRGNYPLWNISERWFETKWGSRVNGKLYGSDMQAWSGKELFLTSLDEGPPKDKLEECRIRSRYIWWAYTPREAANTGDRTKVAHDVYTGKIVLPGPMKVVQVSWDDVPDHVMKTSSRKMREEMLAAEEKKGGLSQANRVTREGGFFFSSPVVFDKFNRQKHVLPLNGELIRRAIKGEVSVAELKEFPFLSKVKDANIIRGFDEGTAHPSSCVWRALLRSGESIFFREWCESAHSITDRVITIIEMSGNERLEVKDPKLKLEDHRLELQRMYAGEAASDQQRERATGAKLPRYREKFKGMRIRKTVADSKLFKVDPQYPLENWGANYSRAGLAITPAHNAPPAQRCDYVNGLFSPDNTRTHLIPAMDDPDSPHGFLIYLTRDCEQLIERLQNYLHGQIINGPRAGDFTGKPDVKDDDLIDGFCYAAIERLRWQHPDAIQRAGDR